MAIRSARVGDLIADELPCGGEVRAIAMGVDTHADGQSALFSELQPGELDVPVDPTGVEHIVCWYDTDDMPLAMTRQLFAALCVERKALGRVLEAEDVLRVERTQRGRDVDG